LELFYCREITDRAQAYSLLALAAERRWGLSALPALARTPHGKPFFPDCPQFRFNLSHSGHIAVCALDERPVGVDVERLRPHHPNLPQRICSPEQLEWLRLQPDPARALCRLWTRKESRVKYHGTGLTVPIRSIGVPLSDPTPTGVEYEGLTFFTLDMSDCSLCVCGHTSPERITPVSVEELLSRPRG